MKPVRAKDGVPALDLIEEAVHLLRNAPAAVLASYAVGALPFVLGLLYFWTDMGHSGMAYQRLAGASLGMAVLYAWMKFWHAVFARRLRALVSGDTPLPLTPRRLLRIFLTQLAIQPLLFIALPIALLITIPFGWVYAFFQNVSVLAEADSPSLLTTCRRAGRLAALWPRQNHFVILIMAAFAFMVFINWVATVLYLPFLLKTLFGLESIFSRSGLGMLNSTFFAVNLSLTYLCVAPILKAVYVLRCFYGDSVESGEDLKAELKRLGPALTMAAVLFLGTVPATAAPQDTERDSGSKPGQVTAAAAPEPAQLDQAIDEVLSQRKYVWRMPPEKVSERDATSGPIGRFLTTVRVWIQDTAQRFIRWLRKVFGGHQSGRAPSGGWGWVTSMHLLLYLLLAFTLALLAVLILRLCRHLSERTIAEAQPLPAVPDLRDESIGAEHLSEEGWMKLASELIERGELRLAIRALFLGTLADLAKRNLVHLARFKSNRDYERELHRRSHSAPGLLAAFGDNVASLERVWYGRHEVHAELVDRFMSNVNLIKSSD